MATNGNTRRLTRQGWSLGRQPDRPAKFDGIEALPKRVQVMPADTAAVQRYITQHCPAA
ncbi:MAG: hypothetical protein KUA38_03230 [Hydrogenophaga sp.]|nr:hypothetical protein [Hydrogenophaga sp.]